MIVAVAVPFENNVVVPVVGKIVVPFVAVADGEEMEDDPCVVEELVDEVLDCAFTSAKRPKTKWNHKDSIAQWNAVTSRIERDCWRCFVSRLSFNFNCFSL